MEGNNTLNEKTRRKRWTIPDRSPSEFGWNLLSASDYEENSIKESPTWGSYITDNQPCSQFESEPYEIVMIARHRFRYFFQRWLYTFTRSDMVYRESRDLFNELGIPITATQVEIEKLYKDFLSTNHPDKNQDLEESLRNERGKTFQNHLQLWRLMRNPLLREHYVQIYHYHLNNPNNLNLRELHKYEQSLESLSLGEQPKEEETVSVPSLALAVASVIEETPQSDPKLPTSTPVPKEADPSAADILPVKPSKRSSSQEDAESLPSPPPARPKRGERADTKPASTSESKKADVLPPKPPTSTPVPKEADPSAADILPVKPSKRSSSQEDAESLPSPPLARPKRGERPKRKKKVVPHVSTPQQKPRVRPERKDSLPTREYKKRDEEKIEEIKAIWPSPPVPQVAEPMGVKIEQVKGQPDPWSKDYLGDTSPTDEEIEEDEEIEKVEAIKAPRRLTSIWYRFQNFTPYAMAAGVMFISAGILYKKTNGFDISENTSEFFATYTKEVETEAKVYPEGEETDVSPAEGSTGTEDPLERIRETEEVKGANVNKKTSDATTSIKAEEKQIAEAARLAREKALAAAKAAEEAKRIAEEEAVKAIEEVKGETSLVTEEIDVEEIPEVPVVSFVETEETVEEELKLTYSTDGWEKIRSNNCPAGWDAKWSNRKDAVASIVIICENGMNVRKPCLYSDVDHENPKRQHFTNEGGNIVFIQYPNIEPVSPELQCKTVTKGTYQLFIREHKSSE